MKFSINSPYKMQVPFPVAISCLLGGFFSQFSWLFFGFNFFLSLFFISNSEITTNLKTPIQTEAVVTHVEKTNFSENKSSVYINQYKFKFNNVEYINASYSTGKIFKINQTTTIEFDKNDPDISRIIGMRSKPFSSIVLFVLTFPVVGLIFLLYALIKNIKSYNLFSNGSLAEGTLIKTEPTNFYINNRRVNSYIFSFTAKDSKLYTSEGRTHKSKFFNEDKEQILYNRDNPKNSRPVSFLPGSITIDNSGNVSADEKWFILLIIPVIVILANIYLASCFFQ